MPAATALVLQRAMTTMASASTPSGSSLTKHFYDHEGWKEQDGTLRDSALFGAKEVGPIRDAAYIQRMSRLLDHVRSAGTYLNLLECGCGGNPELAFSSLLRHYTGVDFSRTGIEAARAVMEESGVPYTLLEGDICRLPFKDSEFDAVYSAHVIYHIPDPDAQAAAFSEAMRVTRAGGVGVFVLANPRPLLFPARLATRVFADLAPVRRVLDAVRRKPPLPYKPMPLGWMRDCLAPFGDVSIEVYALASTWFNQKVSEHGIGALAWRAIERLERDFHTSAAELGNYVQIIVRRR